MLESAKLSNIHLSNNYRWKFLVSQPTETFANFDNSLIGYFSYFEVTLKIMMETQNQMEPRENKKEFQ